MYEIDKDWLWKRMRDWQHQEHKENLYVAATGQYQSYAITANQSLTSTNNLTLSSSCAPRRNLQAANLHWQT